MSGFVAIEAACPACGSTIRTAVDPAGDRLAICWSCWCPVLIGRDDNGDLAVLDRDVSSSNDFRARAAARSWARARSIYLNTRRHTGRTTT